MEGKEREREAREGMSCARKQSHNGQFLVGKGGKIGGGETEGH